MLVCIYTRGKRAPAVLGYAVYLLHASILHGWRCTGGGSLAPQRLWGSFVGLGALRILVGVIASMALADASLKPYQARAGRSVW